MLSTVASLLVFMIIFSNGAEAGEKIKKSEKIIIHVPYKVHNHVHTHTNYKLIKVPEKTIEIHHEPKEKEKEEDEKFAEKEIFFDSFISESKPHHYIKDKLSFSTPSIPDSSALGDHFQDEIDIKKIENRHETHRPIAEQLTNLPTKLPFTLKHFQSTEQNFNFGEKIVLQTFSTEAPMVSFIKSQAVTPTYHVQEQVNERTSHQLMEFEKPHTQNFISKANSIPYAKNYFQKSPHTIRPFQTVKSLSFPTTKPTSVWPTRTYPIPTKKSFALPTIKSYAMASPKAPKKIFQDNEAYEHIGYLVVGQNTQKFVGLNDRKDE